jgi:hypothetical protein
MLSDLGIRSFRSLFGSEDGSEEQAGETLAYKDYTFTVGMKIA